MVGELQPLDSTVGYEDSVCVEKPSAVKTNEFEKSVGGQARRLSGKKLSVLVLEVAQWREQRKGRGNVGQTVVGTPTATPTVRRKRNLVGEFGTKSGVSQSVATQTNLQVKPQLIPDACPAQYPSSTGLGEYERHKNCPRDGTDGVLTAGVNNTGAPWGTVGMPGWGSADAGESGLLTPGGWEWRQGWTGVPPVCQLYGGVGPWGGLGGSPVNATCLGCQMWGTVYC